LKYLVLLDKIEGFLLYSTFKFVRKFKFCVSPLVKRYPGILNMIIYIPGLPLTLHPVTTCILDSTLAQVKQR